MNSKGFFTFDAVACSVYTVSSPYTFLLIFDDLWKEGPSGEGVGFLFLWLFGFGLYVCVCVRVCVDFRMDLQVPESAWSPSADSSFK